MTTGTMQQMFNRTADDVLYSIGLQRRARGGSHLAAAIALLAGGAVVGGALALLCAPSSGKSLRSDLGSRLRMLNERARIRTREAASAVRSKRLRDGQAELPENTMRKANEA